MSTEQVVIGHLGYLSVSTSMPGAIRHRPIFATHWATSVERGEEDDGEENGGKGGGKGGEEEEARRRRGGGGGGGGEEEEDEEQDEEEERGRRWSPKSNQAIPRIHKCTLCTHTLCTQVHALHTSQVHALHTSARSAL
ncbi:hypothetical protein OCS_05120 [Ophiocordyceps sinensis CO18]|uniref:Uncharacterized protein n=1 Tax=Ophiocordyceps sinensis (strain Co18 / CGMCC 3.14243) TaxID=911162 RepID=T5A9U0_OPHSC|nr:hypothetical protein OCS_05120 [Ophiocordyceps sinensis CO18]